MDDYGDDCRGKVAELEAQRDRNYNGWCEATKEVARRALCNCSKYTQSVSLVIA